MFPEFFAITSMASSAQGARVVNNLISHPRIVYDIMQIVIYFLIISLYGSQEIIYGCGKTIKESHVVCRIIMKSCKIFKIIKKSYRITNRLKGEHKS